LLGIDRLDAAAHQVLRFGAAELAAVSSILGKLPTVEEYMAYAKDIDSMAADVYRYLSFDQIAEFREAAANAKIPVVQA
ncbi:hypothetical protein, partial [Pseudomonas aeruginosa]|uniref:hypothetical protein n=1 Tax=Pseudomonas aeruginosa TaxID=287 RepID=UPI00396A97D2